MAPSPAVKRKGTKPQARRGIVLLAALLALGVVVYLRRSSKAAAAPALDTTALGGLEPLAGSGDTFGSGASGGGSGGAGDPATVPPPSHYHAPPRPGLNVAGSGPGGGPSAKPGPAHASGHTTQLDPRLGKHNPLNPNYEGPSENDQLLAAAGAVNTQYAGTTAAGYPATGTRKLGPPVPAPSRPQNPSPVPK